MMLRMTVLFGTCAVCAVWGCGDTAPPVAVPPASVSSTAEAAGEDAKIMAAINELPEEDRALAQAQKFCAVAVKGRLGSMGKPAKVMIDGKPVFLCCDGCQEDALKNPQETLATVDKLKATNQP